MYCAWSHMFNKFFIDVVMMMIISDKTKKEEGKQEKEYLLG